MNENITKENADRPLATEGPESANVNVSLHRNHLPVLLASVRAIKDSAPHGEMGAIFREIEHRLTVAMKAR